MALNTLPPGAFADDAITADKINLANTFAFTGTVTGAAKIGQVVSTHFTTQVTSTSATLSDVSGFSANITPTSTNSKVLVNVSICFGGDSAGPSPYINLKRNGTTIGLGSGASGSQINVFLAGSILPYVNGHYASLQQSKSFLDSPSSTSALTYQIAFASPWQSRSGYINRMGITADAVYNQFPSSAITLMEILA